MLRTNEKSKRVVTDLVFVPINLRIYISNHIYISNERTYIQLSCDVPTNIHMYIQPTYIHTYIHRNMQAGREADGYIRVYEHTHTHTHTHTCTGWKES